jgi:hypothetical protein
LSRRFIIQQMSMPFIALATSCLVQRTAEQQSGSSLILTSSIQSRSSSRKS